MRSEPKHGRETGGCYSNCEGKRSRGKYPNTLSHTPEKCVITNPTRIRDKSVPSLRIWPPFRHRRAEKNSASSLSAAHLEVKQQEPSDEGSTVVRNSAPKQMLLLGESSWRLACVLICSWQKLIPGAFPGQWEYLPWPDNHYGLPLT